MNRYAPIAFFVYNRPGHARASLNALQANHLSPEHDLVVFSDGPKSKNDAGRVQAVRQIFSRIRGFRSVIVRERSENLGLARSIIDGVSEVLRQSEQVIVLEDDLIAAPNFLDFMNQGLTAYKERNDVFSISAYCPPVAIPETYAFDAFLVPTRAASWGWGTWKRVWSQVDWDVRDFDTFLNNHHAVREFTFMGSDMARMLKRQVMGSLDSWSIRFDYHHFKHNAFSVYPTRSKIRNIGMDATGTHSTFTDEYDVVLDEGTLRTFRFPDSVDQELVRRMRAYFTARLTWQAKLRRFIRFLTHSKRQA